MKENFFSVIGNIIAVAVAAVVFFVFLFTLKSLWWLAILLSIVSYIGSLLIFNTGKNRKLTVDLKEQGITEEMVQQTIDEGQKKVGEIYALGKKITDKSIRDKVDGICHVCAKIFEDFEKDPKDIKVAKNFLNHYLDATINILTRYVELSANQVNSPEVNAMLRKVESLLDTIKDTFEKQLAKLLEDDVMDLDVEISVLEKTMKMDGM